MADSIYRRLQDIILADPECAEFAHTNEMPKISSARDKDQRIADVLNRKGVLGRSRAAMATDVQRTLILQREWRQLLASKAPACQALSDLLAHGLPVDFYGDGLDLLVELEDEKLLGEETIEKLRQLSRDPITVDIVSRAVRGPWED